MSDTIFITGATGNIGTAVLCNLLDRGVSGHLAVLVRGDSSSHARRRLFDAVRIYRPGQSAKELASRVEVIHGDISRPRMDIDSRTYSRLCRETTHIIHAAALTCFGANKHAAESINVVGTRNVLDFAERSARTGILKRLLHVSTAYLGSHDFGGIVGPDDVPVNPPEANVYERTKWRAELMVRARFGSIPIVIVRPSIVVGESSTGRIITFNVLYPPLRLLLPYLHADMSLAMDGLLDIVPVDYVANGCLQFLLRSDIPDASGYYLAAGSENSITVGALLESAARLTPYNSSSGVSPRVNIFKLLCRLRTFQPYMKLRATFDCRTTEHLLKGAECTVSPVTEYLPTLLSYCWQTDWGKNRFAERITVANSCNCESFRTQIGTV